MIKVALTGGIGTGKTTAAAYFTELGIPVIDADAIAHDLVKPHQNAFNEIVTHFGQSILLSNGDLDRNALRKIIFNDMREKQWLENLLHPMIDNIIDHKMQMLNTPYCIVIIPLLAEHYERYQSKMDYVVVIDAAQNKQVSRVIMRDQEEPSLVEKIRLSQNSREERLAIADFIVTNNGDFTELRYKIERLHNIFLQKTAKQQN